jgi:hypothetical protein
MAREREESQWCTTTEDEVVSPLIELTTVRRPRASATSASLTRSYYANDNGQDDNDTDENEERCEDDKDADDNGSVHSSSNSSRSNNDADDSDYDDDDDFEPWDDRDPQYHATRQDAVYTCPPKYGTYYLVGIAAMFLFFLSELAHALVRDIGYVGGDVQERKHRQQVVFMYFGWNWIALLAAGLLLPRKYEVLVDSTVVVGTTFTRFRFDDIRSAQRNTYSLNLHCSNNCDTVIPAAKRLLLLRFDFATDGENRVVMKRGGHKWEVACSPKDPDAFVEAIRTICNNSSSNSNSNHAAAGSSNEMV